jgi:hypothetical protein
MESSGYRQRTSTCNLRGCIRLVKAGVGRAVMVITALSVPVCHGAMARASRLISFYQGSLLKI